MQDKFGLRWRMTFEFEDGRSERITIGYPLTIEFDVRRTGKSDDQNASFKIYNLARSTARLLFKDILADNQAGQRTYVYFEMGYEGQYSLVYRGTVMECNTYRDGGSTETVTDMICYDLNLLKYIGKTYSDGTPVKDIIKDVASILQLNIEAIGDLQKKVKGNYTISGNAIEALESLTGGSCYVDNNRLIILSPNEVLDIEPITYSPNRIFGTPRRTNGYVTFNTRITPAVTLFQLINLEDDIQPESNGLMKVFDLRHKGMISASVPCSAQTTLSCYQGRANSEIPLNITNNTTKEEKTEEAPPQTNTKKGGVINKFKKVVGEKILEVGQSSKESLLDIYRDIHANGAKAKSLNKKVIGRVLWHEVIDYPNISGSERPTYEHVSNIYNTLQILLDFIHKNIGNKAIVCTSGWRSPSNNRAVGGKPESRHLKGEAIDFKFSSPALTEKYFKEVFAKKWSYGWTGYYKGGNPWIHIQVAGNKPDRR